MNRKRILTDGVICVLVAANIMIGMMISNSMKPKCVVDECNHIRCQRSFYCSMHNSVPQVEIKLYYGKK